MHLGHSLVVVVLKVSVCLLYLRIQNQFVYDGDVLDVILLTLNLPIVNFKM